MNIIACYSLKGGVGKTTTAINLAYLSAQEGNPTLLWDLDLQGSASLILSTAPLYQKSHKVLTQKKNKLNKQIQTTPFQKLDLLPADFSLHKITKKLYQEEKSDVSIAPLVKRLRKKYQTLIIDCPSGFDPLTQKIYNITDVVLTPVIPSPLSFETLDTLKKQLKKDRKDDNLLLFPFFSMVDRRRKLHKSVLSLHQNGKRGFLNTTIPYSSKAEQMVVNHAPLPSFDSHSQATKGYKSLWNEIKENIGMHARVKKIKMW